jgi:cytidylate kinase
MVLMSRLVVTVDGFSATGKSTLSALLAQRLGWACLNSGRFYRSVAWVVHALGGDPDSDVQVFDILNSNKPDFSSDSTRQTVVTVNGRDITSELETTVIADYTSRVSKHSAVRAYINRELYAAFQGDNLVAEGRDMGTVVFPDAPLKFFVVADARVRAQRRFNQLSAKNIQGSETVESISRELEARDKRDAERVVAPTKPAEGAIIIDNTATPLTQVVEKMYSLAANLAVK